MLLLPWNHLPIHVLFMSAVLVTLACGEDSSADTDESVLVLEEASGEEAPADEPAITSTAGDVSGDGGEAEDTPTPSPTSTEDNVSSTDDGNTRPPEPDSPEEVPTELTFMPLAEAGDVVEFVEVDRYMGVWYEIATTPSFQQLSCFGTQAEYAFDEDNGWVDVTNRCYVGNAEGRVQEVSGRAELVDTDTQAKLDVVFFGQRSPYWVVALDGADGDAPYEWAVVSGPGSFSMWILSRTRRITEQARAEINAHLEARGFDIGALIDTRHADE